MVRRFGARFSPRNARTGRQDPSAHSAPPRAEPPEIRRLRRRARLVSLAAIPLLIRGIVAIIAADPAGLAQQLGAFGLLAIASFLLREGISAQAAYAARSRARRPVLPRKILAALLLGAGVGVASWSPLRGTVTMPVLLGLLATGLHLLTFGTDPMRNKGLDGIDNLRGRSAARAVDEAETYLETMTEALGTLGDRMLSDRLARLVNEVRAMCRTVEDDPRDLFQARRYLGVYLMGARDATLKFVKLYRETGEDALREDYEALLIDLEKSFNTQRRQLLLDDRADLDVEIDVLRDRLRLEGVET